MNNIKITISIPTDILEESQKTAKNLGMSLNEFFTAILRLYISQDQFQNVTEKLNEIYDKEYSAIDPNLMKMQMLSIGKEFTK